MLHLLPSFPKLDRPCLAPPFLRTQFSPTASIYFLLPAASHTHFSLSYCHHRRGNMSAMVRKAFSVMLRRSTKSLLPLATGVVASPMAFQRTITTTQQTVSVRNSLPTASRFFSVAARKYNLRSINLDYLRSVLDSEPEKGDDIPFQMVDISTLNKSEKKFTFIKSYNGEYTCVQVFVDSEVEGNSASSAVLLFVLSRKLNGRLMTFTIRPPLDSEMRIDGLIDCPPLDHLMQESIEHPGVYPQLNKWVLETVGDLGIRVYKFSELDKHFQDGLVKYIAARGITADWWRKVAPVMC